MTDPEDSEALARCLERHLDYRVLRRVKRRDVFADPIGDTRIGVLLDTETTGLDRREDQIIELAMIVFEFDDRGQVCGIVDRFHAFNDPGCPLPAEVVELTGITDAMVGGLAIDRDEVARIVGPAAVVIAHNAGFDRVFAERLHPVFATKAWACSLAQVPWRGAGIGSAKLDYLAMRYGLFHDGHRGLADCELLLEILARALPGSAEPTLKRLLDTARQPTWRVWALDSPFDRKDRLKARGYRWNDGSDGNPRAWYRDVPDTGLEEERRYLTTEIQPGPCVPQCVRVTAFDRFSERV